MAHKIRDTIIAPSHPGFIYALIAKALRHGLLADRALFPQEALDEDSALFEAVKKIVRKYVGIHGGETVHVISRPDYTVTMARLMQEIRMNGLSSTMRVQTEFEELPILDITPSHTVWTCGDGRPWYWRSLIELHRHLGAPRVITPPGEEQWLINNPELADSLQGWIDRQPTVPRVVVKHAGCGYRGFKGPPEEERAAALEECVEHDTLYLWQPGEGDVWFETLRERQKT